MHPTNERHAHAALGREAPRCTLSLTDRVLQRFATLLPGEGACVFVFSCYALLLLTCYYIVKTLREPLLLVDGSAELKSYAYAVVAGALLVFVPIYGAVSRRCNRKQLTHRITGAFVVSLAILAVLVQKGAPIGFAYFVWSGVFGVTMLAQFWAHAAAAFNVECGRRLIPSIMAGAALGGLIGPGLTAWLFPALGTAGLMVVAAVILAATLPFARLTLAAVPPHAAAAGAAVDACRASLLGGLSLVLRDRFLLLLAVMVMLLNCVNTTGDYILTGFVLDRVDTASNEDSGLRSDAQIASFYGNYYLTINALSLLLQIGLTARLLRWINVRGTVLVLPILAAIGYGLVVFVPVFAVIQLVKVLENSTDYSIMNTARQLLYLPSPESHKFEGKAAIETLFWRLGDVLPAAIVFLGLRYLDMSYEHFAVVNLVLVAVWIAIASRLGRMHRSRIGEPAQFRCNRLTVLATTALIALLAPAMPARIVSPVPGEPQLAVMATSQPLRS